MGRRQRQLAQLDAERSKRRGHGIRGRRRHGHHAAFAVFGSAEAGEVAISVTDSGNWRPERSDGRGRGLVLMRAMMDVVEIVPGAEGTTVRMQRRLGSGAGG